MRVIKPGLGRSVRGWLTLGMLGFVAACEGAQADSEESVELRAPVAASTGGGLPQSRDTPVQMPIAAAPRRAGKPVVHLSTGDSVEIVAVGPAMVPNQPTGVLFTYHPFFAPDVDSIRTIRVADELWRSIVRPGLREPPPPFVVLQATSRRAGPIVGTFNEVTYGVVLERRPDGKWYRLGTSLPVD